MRTRFTEARLAGGGGTLDPSFGGAGNVTTDFSGRQDVAYAVAIQADAKIVVAGEADAEQNPDFAVARYNVDGSLDGDFADGGKARFEFAAESPAGAGALAVQADGKIVVVGGAAVVPSRAYDFAMARLNPDGTLDRNFGDGGTALTDFSAGSDWASAVAVQPDGKIVVAGERWAWRTSQQDFALARYTPEGRLDPTFGGDGKVVADFGGSAEGAFDLALQRDGKIVLAGRITTQPGSLCQPTCLAALARFDPSGALDASFDGDGVVSTDFGAGTSAIAYAVTVQSDGKIVAAGEASGGFGLVRYNIDGTLDSGFGTQGKTVTRAGNAASTATAVAIQPSGKIIAIGFIQTGPGDFALARYTRSGALDQTFGSAGTAVSDLGGQDAAWAGTLARDGKIVAVGGTRPIGGGSGDFVVARYLVPRCVVPDVRRKTLQAARAAIIRANCAVGSVKRAASNSVPSGRIVSQSPRSPATLPELAPVHLVVSAGPRR